MAKLEKLKIIAYSDSDFTKKVENAVFEGLINPESYQESYVIQWDDSQALGADANDSKFKKILPGSLTLKLLLDSTGVFDTIENVSDALNSIGQNISAFSPVPLDVGVGIGVSEKVDFIKKTVLFLNGNIHQPNFLNIMWGALDCNCRLTKLDIDYKIFNSDGFPIRVVLTLTLENTESISVINAKANKKSPDLTHLRMIKAGDTLPLLSFDIYGDSKYYLEVARVNKLRDFRRLKPGQKIFFPPLKKTNE